MKGKNVVQINQATIKLIVQDWFDRNAPTLLIKVDGVTSNPGDMVFDVETSEKTDEGTGPTISNN